MHSVQTGNGRRDLFLFLGALILTLATLTAGSAFTEDKPDVQIPPGAACSKESCGAPACCLGACANQCCQCGTRQAKQPGKSILVAGGTPVCAPLEGLEADDYYGLTVWFPELKGLAEADKVTVKVKDASGEVVSKTLHGGDPDLYVTLKPRKAGDGCVELSAASGLAGKTYQLRVACSKMNLGLGSDVLIAAQPNTTWQNAQPIELGKTVFASNDERPYIPELGGPESTFRDLLAGAQWFTFTWAGPKPVLVHFLIDILDRDVPVDVAIFTRQGKGADEKLVPYEEGEPRHIPEQTTSFHGLYKFAPRVIRPGTYCPTQGGLKPSP